MKAAFIDFETTGLNPKEGQVLEVAIVLCETTPNQIEEVVEMYHSFNDPGQPISDEIFKITHISDDMVKGHKIDWDKVNSLLDQADVIVAHNAQFDKGWAIQHGKSKDRPWTCSVNQIKWRANPGIERSNLEYLKQFFKIEMPSHRAITDVATLCRILKQEKADGETFWSELYKNRDEKTQTLYAYVPFSEKDRVKQLGFYWTPEKKAWRKNAMSKDIEPLKKTLKNISNLIKIEVE